MWGASIWAEVASVFANYVFGGLPLLEEQLGGGRGFRCEIRETGGRSIAVGGRAFWGVLGVLGGRCLAKRLPERGLDKRAFSTQA